MTSPTPARPMKPTLDTPYHIDYDWFATTEGEDLRVYLLSHLPPALREQLEQGGDSREMDFIDPTTGQVQRLDALRLAVRQAAQAPDFINRDIGVVDCLFRVFLRNDNTAQSPRQLAELTGHPAQTVLNLISKRVYKGIRPAP
ncbi:MAG: hypothetical protein MUC99_06205 [Anaerolineae bacterium]|jgi:hypothetical protein|nr:hypothetical protein [Anaerolineae bacterium]